MAEFDEQSLIEQAQRDPQAFAQLYDRYIDRIFAYACRQTGDVSLAQDVTSATFEKALRNLQRYRWQDRSFCAWLYRIARNEAIAFHRRQRLLAPLGLTQSSEAYTEEIVDNRQQIAELRMALVNLPDKDREVLTLHFFEDLSSAEVSEIIGCTVNTVYVRLHRALERLRKELERRTIVSRDSIRGERNYD